MAPQKIGFYSLRKAARLMCKYVYIFTPIIQKTYPNNTLLLAALAAANVACQEVIEQIDLQAVPGV